jgi:pimeloyl-ACP methyl ester carboxylesterase
VRGAVGRAFFPAQAPEAYLAIAPRLALEDSALAGDGEDRRAAEEGVSALRRRYAGLRVPLVIVVGRQDRIVPAVVSERLHALVPGSELVSLPEAGHMPQFTAPDAVVAAVDRAAALAGGATTFASPGERG